MPSYEKKDEASGPDIEAYVVEAKPSPHGFVAPIEDEEESARVALQLLQAEDGHDIRFRTMGWKTTAALLFGEYAVSLLCASRRRQGRR